MSGSCEAPRSLSDNRLQVVATLEGGERTRAQFACLPVELEGLQAQPLDLTLGALDLGAAVLELLLTERQTPLAFDEVLLGVLDQLPARVEIGCDLVEAPCARVDLRRPAGHRLLHQALPFGERLPGLLELVPLFRHLKESCPPYQTAIPKSRV